MPAQDPPRSHIRRSAVKLGSRALLRHASTIDDLAARTDFSDIRARVVSSGTDSLVHLGYDYEREGGLALQQHPDEFAAFCTFVRLQAPVASYLEIGVASGGACRFLASHLGFGQAFVLDDGNHPRASEQAQNLKHVPGLARFIGDSHSPDAQRWLEENVSQPIDLAFIDGDHSYEGVWSDLQLVLPVMRRGGLIAFHDTVVSLGVREAWARAIMSRGLVAVGDFRARDRPLGIGVLRVGRRTGTLPAR